MSLHVKSKKKHLFFSVWSLYVLWIKVFPPPLLLEVTLAEEDEAFQLSVIIWYIKMHL